MGKTEIRRQIYILFLSLYINFLHLQNVIVQGYMQTTLANKELKWETSTQTDMV
jgi:hypothetical protein